jgi:hypothetical protein
LLNYGRIKNNVLLQDAQFRQLVTAYQSAVLQGDLEVENGIVTFVQAHERAHDLQLSVDEAWIALEVIIGQYRLGLSGIDFNRYATIQQTLITQQDSWAQARGQICLGLIDVYRGLGGGWQIKCGQVPDKRGILSTPKDQPAEGAPATPAPSDDTLPAPTNPATAPVAPLPPLPPSDATTTPPVVPDSSAAPLPPQPTQPVTPELTAPNPATAPVEVNPPNPGADLLPPPAPPKP